VRSPMRTLVPVLVSLSASLILAASAQSQILTVTGNYSGGINGGVLSGTSSGTIDVSGLGVNDMAIDFTSVPPGYHPFAVACRKISHIGGNGAKDSLGTMNLWQLAGGTYTATTVYTWPSLPGDTIRSFATVSTSGSTMQYDVNYQGAYHGFTDLVRLSNYRLQYTMPTPGVLVEDASGTVHRAGGGTFVVNTRTVYGGVEKPLPFSSQSGTFKINTYTFDGSDYRFSWNVTLAPGSAVPGPEEWQLGLVGLVLVLLGAAAMTRSPRVPAGTMPRRDAPLMS